eukprot:UN05337
MNLNFILIPIYHHYYQTQVFQSFIFKVHKMIMLQQKISWLTIQFVHKFLYSFQAQLLSIIDQQIKNHSGKITTPAQNAFEANQCDIM